MVVGGWWQRGGPAPGLMLLAGLAAGSTAAHAGPLPVPSPKPVRSSTPDTVRPSSGTQGQGASRSTDPEPSGTTGLRPLRTGGSWPLPRPKPDQSAPAAPEPPAEGLDSETIACLARLDRLGVVRTPAAPISDPKGCSVAAPITVTAIGTVAVEPPILTTCPFAEALAGWITEVVIRDARLLLGTEPKAIAAGTSYQCRPRNGIAGAKLSEHGTASALDLSGITFATGPRLDALPPRPGDDSPMARFAASIRAGACRHFTTVLGPGSDATHQDHYHFDVARRRNGFRICQ